MDIKSKRNRDTLIAELSGEIDHHSAESVREELDTLIDDISIRNLILDFKHVKFMDSSGIGVILGRYKVMSKRHGNMSIMNTTPHIDKIFEMSGIYKVIKKIE